MTYCDWMLRTTCMLLLSLWLGATAGCVVVLCDSASIRLESNREPIIELPIDLKDNTVDLKDNTVDLPLP